MACTLLLGGWAVVRVAAVRAAAAKAEGKAVVAMVAETAAAAMVAVREASP